MIYGKVYFCTLLVHIDNWQSTIIYGFSAVESGMWKTENGLIMFNMPNPMLISIREKDVASFHGG